MKKTKKQVGFRIDSELWDLAKVMLPCSRGEFIEKQLNKYINTIDDIEELEKEIEEIKQTLQVKEDKLKHLKVIRESNSRNKENLNKSMETVKRIVLNHGAITEEQIKYIANSNNIYKEVLKDLIKKNQFKIV